MRRASYDKTISCTKRNIVSNQGYQTKSSLTKDVDYKRVNYSSQTNNQLQRSVSADNVVIRSRGFKPSDRHDPAKRNFLENLTSKILHFEMDSGEATPINLQKLLTPAMDTSEFLQAKHKKMYASSCFYAPTHPTVEDQVELARRISYSLSDVKNMKSKGQSMYVNRKKRSVKWIHDGNGDEGEEEPASPVHKDKVPLKCMMNPNGKVLDLHGIQALGEEVNMGTSPANAEKLFDIVRDLNNQKGRGAEIFAKRRKRSEKWVVDKEQCQTPTTPSSLTKPPGFPSKLDMGTNENAKFTSLPPLTPLSTPLPTIDTKPFYNPFTLDLSLESVTPQRTGNDQRCVSQQSENGTSKYTEVKKVYLREIAVGTDADYQLSLDRNIPVEKSKRMSYEASVNPNENRQANGSSNRRNKSLTSNGNGPNRENGYGNMNAKHGATNNGYRRGSERSHSNPHPHNHPQHHHHHHHRHQQYQQYQYQCCEQPQQQPADEIIDETEYTPVPVKQLIQEFEKTCRPVMQYKQISPKVIPIVQQCPPLDNDISRFFESSRMANNEQQIRSGNGGANFEPSRMANNEQQIRSGNGGANFEPSRMANKFDEQIRSGNGVGNFDSSRMTKKFDDQIRGGNGVAGSKRLNGNKVTNGNGMNYNGGYPMRNEYDQQMRNMVEQTVRYEEYDSSEDEIDDSFGDSESETNYRRADGQIYDDEFQSSGYTNGNDTRATSNGTMDEYEMYVRQFDESTELFEAPPGFRNGESGNLANGNGETKDSKSMVLAMVASQEDILDTIKHLRNTPILENLLGAPSPDFFADVGNKLSTESTYQGPKIASFQTLTNYNTAPRGWDQSQNVYRPVTFGKQQEPIPYSDF